MYIAEMVDEIHELGIEDVVLSPGSRSTPLAILFLEHKFNIYMDIDERSAAFFALGIAKAKNKPVVLVCTSGSACAHYLPAAIEAKHSRIPLIFLTADRPPRLQNVGAPQTINQNNIFGNFAKYYEELAIEFENQIVKQNLPSYARSIMQKAYMNAKSCPQMAVHINIPLDEPLVPDMNKLDFSQGRLKKPFVLFEGEVHNEHFIEYFVNNCLGKNGIIVCGPNIIKNDEAYYKDLIELASILNAPILADPLSQFRAYKHKNIISSYNAFLKSEDISKNLQADYIILIGQSPVSKSLFNFLKAQNNCEIFQLDTHFEYRNPALNTSKFVHISEWTFAKKIIKEKNSCTNNTDYLEKWQTAQERMSKILCNQPYEDAVFEGGIIERIQDISLKYSKQKNNNKVQLVIANSMSIRDIDLFWQAKEQEIFFYGSRGVNGIDGTISTALGIAANGQSCSPIMPTVLISGDLALFHDITGFLVGTKHNLNLTIVVFNNNGGGIFQYLPQANVNNFEYLFITPHDLDFSALAKLYNIEHCTISSYKEFNDIFEKSLHSTGINIIEVPINRHTSKELHALYELS